MVGARTAAMALNRVIDKAIDKRNPSTENRAIPAGLISIQQVIIYIIISFAMLFWATSHLSSLSMKLLPIAVFFLVFYSYTKRFTWTCHFVLGLTLGLSSAWGLDCRNRSIYMVFYYFLLNSSMLECWFRSDLCLSRC